MDGTHRPLRSELGSRLRSGLAWKAASLVTGSVLRTAMTVTLAHLLTPSDFGIAGMVLLFAGVIQLLADVGFSASLIQLNTLTEEDCSTAFWTGLAIAGGLFATSIAIAPAVAGFYHEPRLRWMFVAVSTGFITTALSTTQASLLWRRMEFRALELRGMLASTASAAVGIGAALAGLGTWSLIVQANALSITSMVAILLLSPWRPKFVFSRASLKRIAGFSTNVFLARLFAYGDRNADNLLVGRYLGSAALGIYSIGYSIIVIPFSRLVDPIQNVLTPALASLQTDLAAMRALWLRSVRAMTGLIVPAMAGVIVVCPDFVSVVLGRRWEPATRVVQILAWVAFIQCIAFVSVGVYQARSRSRLLLRVSGLGFVLDLGSFVLGLHWGVIGVATGYALVNTLLLMPLNVFLLIRLLDCTLPSFIGELRGVIEATVAMAALTLTLRLFLVREKIGADARLGICLAAGIVLYALLCWWREPRIFSDLRLRKAAALPTHAPEPQRLAAS